MPDAMTAPARIARLLQAGDRLLVMNREDAGREAALFHFLTLLAEAMQGDWKLLRAVPVTRYLDKIEADGALRSGVGRWADTRLHALESPGAAAVDDRAYAILLLPTAALRLVLGEKDNPVDRLLEWIGGCIRMERAFFSLRAAPRAGYDLAALGTRLCDALAGILAEMPVGAPRWRAAAAVRGILEGRPALKLLFSEMARPADYGDLGNERQIAFVATASIYRIDDIDQLLALPEAHDLLYKALSAWNNFPLSAEDIAREVRMREHVAEACLDRLRKARGPRDIEDVSHLAVLTAPRNYSAEGTYRKLQELRAEIFDRLVRIRHQEVDALPETIQPGRIGLVAASLSPSAETQAIVAHYEGLVAAGADPILILWPHHACPSPELAPSMAHWNILDLCELAVEDRVSVVRACGFDCLIFMNNLTWGWSDYIAASTFRMARIQVATYLSVITVGFANLDYFLVGETSEGEGAAERYIERLCTMRGSVLCFPAAEEGTPRARTGSEAPVLVCGSTFPKLTPSALQEHFRLAELAAARKLIFYPFNPAWGASLPHEATLAYMQRIAARTSGFDVDRIELAGPWPDHSAISALLDASDLYLDSYPHSGGLSVLEAARVGLPVAYHSGRQQRSRQAHNVVTAVGARTIDFADGPPSKEQVDTLLAGTGAAASSSELSDVPGYGERLRSALAAAGVAGTDSNPDLGRCIGTTKMVQVQIGAGIKVMPGGHSRRGSFGSALFWSGATSVSASGRVASTSCFKQRAGTVIVGLAGTGAAGEESAQLFLRLNGAACGWTQPLSPLGEHRHPEAFVIQAKAGWNFLEFGWNTDGQATPGAFGIEYLVPSGSAPLEPAPRGVRWIPLEGFDYWEEPYPPRGLMRPFRWVSGSSASIRIVLDRPETRLVLRIRTLARRLDLEILVDGEFRSYQDEFPGDLGEDVEVNLDEPFAAGEHVIQFRMSPERMIGTDRALAFILTGVEAWEQAVD